MTYFVYHVDTAAVGPVRKLSLLARYDKYREARGFAREKRLEINADDPKEIKIIFADSALEAEEKLQEFRERPILMEHEK